MKNRHPSNSEISKINCVCFLRIFVRKKIGNIYFLNQHPYPIILIFAQQISFLTPIKSTLSFYANNLLLFNKITSWQKSDWILNNKNNFWKLMFSNWRCFLHSVINSGICTYCTLEVFLLQLVFTKEMWTLLRFCIARKILKICQILRTIPTHFRNIAQNVIHLSNFVRYLENVWDLRVISNIFGGFF